MSSTDKSSSSTQTPNDDPDHQKELSALLRTLEHDPTLNGIHHLGKDGIIRSLTADRTILSAIPLRPELIKAFIDRFPYSTKAEERYRGVDGTKTPKEQWFDYADKDTDFPPPYIPPPERMNLSEEQLEKNRKWLKDRREMKERGDGCDPVKSNHDLGLGGGSGEA